LEHSVAVVDPGKDHSKICLEIVLRHLKSNLTILS